MHSELRERRGPAARLDDELTVDVRLHPAYVHLVVAGEVDMVSVPRLRAVLTAAAAAGRVVIVDLARVSFIDAAGLGVLAGAARRCSASGGSLSVVAAGPLVRQMFSLTRLDQRVRLAATLADAAAAALAAA